MRTMIAAALLAASCVLPAAANAAEDSGWRLMTRADLPDAAATAPGIAAGRVAGDGRWVFINPVTGELQARPPGSTANGLTADLMRDGQPGPDLRVQQTPEGWLKLDTRGIRHYRVARLQSDGRVQQLCRDNTDTAANLGFVEPR